MFACHAFLRKTHLWCRHAGICHAGNKSDGRFRLYALRPHVSTHDVDVGSLPEQVYLPLAATYLGNFDAFALLTEGSPAHDDAFHCLPHFAAFLALPRFVEKLLETHDANLKED